MIPATRPTSSIPETCFAAIAARTTGRIPIRVSNTVLSPANAGILLSANTSAMEMNPGIAAIIIPLKLMRFQMLPSWTEPLDEDTITGMYFNFHSFARADTKATALVRFVVPVVPEAEMTLPPSDWVLAIDVPPVPTSGIFLAAAAVIARLFTPFGSQLRSIIASISPFVILSASCLSDVFAISLISLRGASSLSVISPFSRVYSLAFVPLLILSIELVAPIN